MAKLKETRAGDWLAERDQPISMPSIKLPAPVMAFAMEPVGDEDKAYTALRRLQEEDPTIDLHRDPQTGEQIVAGLSQIHVEVIVDRMKSRFGAEVNLKPPRVPYQETIRGSAKAHGRHKKQTGGRGQFGDCHIEIEPLPDGDGFEFVNAIKGGVIPTGFIPAVEKGVLEAMQQGAIAGYPIKGVRVRLFDGSYHTVDSSEMAFKMAGSLAMKQALEQAKPVLLEPIMLVTASVPDESVGDVMGDLSSRRGRPLGTEAVGGMTEVKAEVPMAEMLSYAPDLRSITGGQGEYTLEFLRYEEVPAHLAQKVIAKAQRGRGGGRALAAIACKTPGGPLLDSPGASWRRPRTSRPTRRTSPATSAGARCCAASTPRATSRPASAARSASCAPRAPSTRAGSASPAATTSRCAIRAARAAGARSSTACARAASARARSTTRSPPTRRSPAPAPPSRRREREREREEAPEPVAEAPRRPRHVRAVPTNADLKMERALEVFNALRPHAHRRRRRPLARRPRGLRPPARRAPERRRDHRHVGALLVPLRGRPLRRGRRRAARCAGRRAVRALRRGAGRQRRRRRPRRAAPQLIATDSTDDRMPSGGSSG